MLPQVFLLLAIMITFGFAALTETFISAKLLSAKLISQNLDVAMQTGTAHALDQAQTFVRDHSTSSSWPTGPQTVALNRPICATLATSGPCVMEFTSTWTVKSTSNSTPSGTPRDTAQNMQGNVINEQRVAITLVSTVMSSTTGETMGSRSRFMTLRVFNAPPYAMIAGSQEVTSLNGDLGAAQGDSGGVAAFGPQVQVNTSNGKSLDSAVPVPENPDRYRDTSIKVQITCVNRDADPNPYNKTNNVEGLHWGAGTAPAYEIPCDPANTKFPLNKNVPPSPLPINPLAVDANNLQSKAWTNKDVNSELR